MLLILPISFQVETSMNPKKVARKIHGEIVENIPTINFMATSKFIKAHKTDSVYYGRFTSATNFQMFYHMAGKRDGSTTGFYGSIDKSDSGSVITGKFRKPVHTYVFSGIWTLVVLFFALMMFALKENLGGAITLGVWIAGVFLMFWDNKKKFLREYLEGLSLDS